MVVAHFLSEASWGNSSLPNGDSPIVSGSPREGIWQLSRHTHSTAGSFCDTSLVAVSVRHDYVQEIDSMSVFLRGSSHKSTRSFLRYSPLSMPRGFCHCSNRRWMQRACLSAHSSFSFWLDIPLPSNVRVSMILSFLWTVKPFLAICSIYVVYYHLTQTSRRKVCLSASPDRSDHWRVFVCLLTSLFLLSNASAHTLLIFTKVEGFYFRGANMCTNTVIGFVEFFSENF